MGRSGFSFKSSVLTVGVLCASGFAQITGNMTVLSKFLHPGTTEACSGLWGWVSPSTGKEYALMTVQTPGGLSVVDISAPAVPKEVVFIPGVSSNWQEVSAYRNHVYKVHQQGNLGLQIIDMSGLNSGGVPKLVTNSTKYFTTAHTIYCDTASARLFVTYGSTAGVAIYSLANPADPVEVARLPGEAHDMFARGNRMYVSTQNRGTVEIYDLSTVATPKKIGVIDLKAQNKILGETAPMAHSCWPSNDNKFLFTAEENSGNTTKSWNIEDPLAPKYLGKFKSKPGIISHNVYMHGKYLYVAHNNVGLRIWNVDNPAAIKEEGFHSPSTSTAEFGGTWGAFPFFPSGLLIHGDRDLGLYVVEPAAHLIQKGVSVSTTPWKRTRTPFTISAMDAGTVRFHLPQVGDYALSIFTPAGKEIYRHRATALSESQSLAFENAKLSNGTYTVRLRQGGDVFSSPIFLGN